MKEEKKRKPKVPTDGSLIDLTLGDILVDTNCKQKRVLAKGFENGVESYLLSKRDNFDATCGWYTIEEINKKGYTLAEQVRTQHKLPKEIKRSYMEDKDKRNLKRIVLTAFVSVIAVIIVFSLVSLVTSALRVKTATRLDHVKDKACLNLVRRLDGKSDAAKHLEFQKCADMYVSNDLETIYK